ncbi:hypothetical protein [Planctomonas psychrotolerans]|uniref:hypothetical protein n=1 Tax=Planctomonas psychrotolerans TaxID=2528712 RepID=UPI00123BC839|nr:hypothetical protein [Planctomonas psychrotolerans]
MDTSSTGAAPSAAGVPAARIPAVPSTVTIAYDGHSYRVTTEMAEAFLTRALAVLKKNESDLVPLTHAEGVELLFISPRAQFSLGSADGSHSRGETELRL